jgi:hypothetical protein
VKSKQFYEGAKARENDRCPFTADDGTYEHAKRMCPYPEESSLFSDWITGYLACCDPKEIEDFVDPTQLTYEEVEEFSRKPEEPT